MCGIVGIVGKKQAKEILIQGLEKLEYRGYDSAGIYLTGKNQKDHLIKASGRIAVLKEKLTENMQGTSGIGHTRWATHGEPSIENAHPHISADQRFVLVHNGVIENFEEIKENYLEGVDLASETDTEIAVQLMAVLAKKQNLTAKQALKKSLTIIRGSYAFALMDREDPEFIYAAKNKSPLLIGVGEGFNAICSDAMAMLSETNHFVEIHDGELVVLSADAVTIEDAEGQTVVRDSFEASLDLTDIEKGTYSYYMLKEIDEQPAVMRRILQKYCNEEQKLEIPAEIISDILKSDRIYIVACGTSWHAGWVGKYLLETCGNIPVEVHLSSEFGYNMPILSKNPFFIFLSQSGETADSRQVLVQINQLGFPSLTLTNVSGSTLSRESKHTLLLHAGPEIAVASTKA